MALVMTYSLYSSNVMFDELAVRHASTLVLFPSESGTQISFLVSEMSAVGLRHAPPVQGRVWR